MKDFLQTGHLGLIRVGMSRGEVTSILGQPDDHSLRSHSSLEPVILKYGDFEFHFTPENLLSLIYMDDFTVPQGGSRLPFDPWLIRRGMPESEFERSLSSVGIRCIEVEPPDSDCTWLQTEGGITAVFVSEATYASPPAGLSSLWKAAT